jgi:hypothetical protein
VPTNNNIGAEMNLFESNLRDPNYRYFYPSFLSVLMVSSETRIPFFQDYGILTGLYHEPHIITFLITPSFFLIYRYLKSIKSKIIVFLCYILTFLISTSATNLMSLTVTILIFIVVSNRSNLLYILSFSLIALFGYLYFQDTALFSFIQDKLTSGSSRYSQSTISFAFTPKTILGTSFYNLEYLDTYWNNANKSMDVGFINFILNIIFLSIFIFRIIIINLKRNYENSFYIGLVSIYFLLHSMKITMYSYSLSYTIFIIFLINVIYNMKSNKINA